MAAEHRLKPDTEYPIPHRMCLIVAWFDPGAEYPLIVGANRDEYYDRPGESPRRLNDGPRIWGGKDPRAGGTWLGLNEFGLLVAITDGPSHGQRPECRSRGLLCLDALKCPDAETLAGWLYPQTAQNQYNSFNLFWSDGGKAFIAHWTENLRMRGLPPGLHILANHPSVNNESIPKIRRCNSLLDSISDLDTEKRIRRIEEACADHGESGEDACCIHGQDRGTLSSSLIALHRSGLEGARYLHAAGKPCEKEFREFTGMLQGPGREGLSPLQ